MKKRTAISKKLRFEIFKRDSFTCQYCGASAPETVLQVDHITPVAKGGDNEITNLITSCFPCNIGKGAKSLDDDSVIKKQKAQLDELNQRREQLEMMADWRSGLNELAEVEIDIAVSEFNDLCRPYGVAESGKKIIARTIKKHGLHKTLKAIEKSCEINLRYCSDGDPHQMTVDVALENIPKAIRLIDDPPHFHTIRYINGIVRNRLGLSWKEQDELKSELLELFNRGCCLKELQEKAKSINDLDDLTELLDTAHEKITS